ncbi:MAG: tRNA (N6-threonylcarbamoyladenosine(37)-N6)-methyltransferase TrmO, partial [Clostridia bacterium]|nr:tRNA (N6-threonylcarbamoyladenosine(37)-N6)-methyltransferase TrmO [Clostridia bacterium]
MELRPIAYLHGDFPEKFGVPRQSGLARTLSRVVFEPEFRDPNALRGIEEYSHLWLIWQFSENAEEWQPTVRPPRLGGNTRVGVFATRSPFRPNPLGLSLVRLVKAEKEPGLGVVLWVEGADMVDGTPVFDIKPYLPYA